jgi:hypothetical protein
MTLFADDMDIAAMTISARQPTRETRWLANAGLGIMAAAIVWWFLFYAQWSGPLRMLDLKVPCLVTTLGGCSFFQSRLDAFHAAGPAYHPAALWIGMATFVAGRVTGMLVPARAALHARAELGLGRDSQKDGDLRD